MLKSDLAFFKVPPEILKYSDVAGWEFYPANYAQYKAFNCGAYDQIQIDDECPDDLVDLKLKQLEIIRRDCFWLIPSESVYSVRARLSRAYAWGRMMREQKRVVFAWNQFEIDSLAMRLAGPDVIWLENGYARQEHFYCDPLIDVSAVKKESETFLEFRHQKYSVAFNLLDILLNKIDRYACVAYYLQKASRLIKFKARKKNCIGEEGVFKIVFLGQLDYDANTIVNGNGYSFMLGIEAMRNVVNELESTGVRCKAVVRVHPNASPYYRRALRRADLFAEDVTDSMEECVGHFDGAITINSSAATWFIDAAKPVLFLGKGEFVDAMKFELKSEQTDWRSFWLDYGDTIASDSKRQLRRFVEEGHIKKSDLAAYFSFKNC